MEQISYSTNISYLCEKCHKPLYYIGDWFGGEKPWCTCNANQSVQMGWQCPVCSRVNAPFVATCPCTQIKWTITTGGT
mgnify:CR=1 FL=1